MDFWGPFNTVLAYRKFHECFGSATEEDPSILGLRNDLLRRGSLDGLCSSQPMEDRETTGEEESRHKEVQVNDVEDNKAEDIQEKVHSVFENLTANRENSWKLDLSKDDLEEVLRLLEAICTGDDSTEESTANVSSIIDKIVGKLRRLSLYISPSLPAEFLQELTPYYIGRCRDALKEVFERMMYILPVEMQSTSSPSCSYVADIKKVVEKEDKEEETVSEKSAALDIGIGIKKKLIRHRSFQETHSRQIMVPQKKKKKASHRNKISSKAKKSPNFLNRLRKREEGRRVNQLRKSACRRLFSRSATVDGMGGVSALGDKEKDATSKQSNGRRPSRVLVQETPLKMQVDSRLRLDQSMPVAGVQVVEESPKRSFYSLRKWTPLTPQFKTPPLSNPRPSRLSPNIAILNKHPSPAAIESLLHDKFTPTEPDSISIATSPLAVATLNQQDPQTAMQSPKKLERTPSKGRELMTCPRRKLAHLANLNDKKDNDNFTGL